MGRIKRISSYQGTRAEEFIAAITQHIPEKSFHMVRYYVWYSNKSRGIRKKQDIQRPGEAPQARPEDEVEIIEVSEYQPRRVPSNKPSRDPPSRESSPKGEIVYEPFDDGWSGDEEPSIMVN